MPAAKRFSIDVNGNKQTTQTYNINAGEGVRGEGLRFRLPPGNKVELTDETTRTGPKSIKAQRVGENLHIAFLNTDIKTPDVVIEGFYAKGQAAELIGKGSGGKYFEYSVVSSDKLPAENTVLTAALSNKATTPWGDPGAAVETVVSAERAGVIVAPGASESARTASPPASGSASKAAGATAPSADPTPVAKAPLPSTAPEPEGGGSSWGTVGWVLGGVGLVGLAAAGGGGGGGDGGSSPAPAPAPAPVGPSITLSGPASIDEDGGTATYTATLSEASTTAVSAQYSVAGGTATAASDFNAVSGTLTFAAGVTTQTFTVPILDDRIVEGAQTYTVALASPTNATLGASSSVTTSITDNDTQTVTANRPTAETVAEGASAVFTVTLNARAEVAVQHSFVIGGTATAGTDRGDPVFSDGVTYDANAGKITVPAGVGSFTVTVSTATGDGFDFAETIVVTVDTTAAQVTIPINLSVGDGTNASGSDPEASADSLVRSLALDEDAQALVLEDASGAQLVYAEKTGSAAGIDPAVSKDAAQAAAQAYSAGTPFDDLLQSGASGAAVTGA